MVEVGFIRFSLLVLSGKFARYAIVAFLTLAGKSSKFKSIPEKLVNI
jgi:hypothetical protein